MTLTKLGAILNLANSCFSVGVLIKPYTIGITALTYSLVLCIISGVLGYAVYGEYTHIYILNNFFIWPGGNVVTVMSATILINLVGSYSNVKMESHISCVSFDIICDYWYLDDIWIHIWRIMNWF